eukprot:1615580-Ditylum_brightwellii.AAC.1
MNSVGPGAKGKRSWKKKNSEPPVGWQQKVFYRCKKQDAKLYALMNEAYIIFQTQEVLMQSMHTYSTQLNEGMNLDVA